jgi:hypothetical protein
MLSRFLVRLVTGILLYSWSFIVITAATAVIGCLFLPNGQVGYLLDPAELLTFIWVTRAGLKVTILAVTTAVFLLLVGDGTLNRKWI